MKKILPRDECLNRKRISLAVACCFATDLALANPTAPTLVHGSAAFQQHGNILQITNSPNAIINWGSFAVGANEITRFVQQSAGSAVLNRVIGQDPSTILGALQSNGRVFLINPNGILFGAGAQIDVAGLVASTLDISNADFLAARLKFTELPGAGSIINQGSITTGSGGNVYLIAPDVTNSGIITSPKGEVVLAAGKSVELVNPGTPNLRVEINAPDNAARNLGEISAESGRIGIYAGLINHSGTIRADSAIVGENGRILLKATKNTTVESGSVISADGPSGGTIEIQSGDTALVSGTIRARGTAAPTNDALAEGKGGTIHVLGHKVGVIGNALIDASGETGGGTVLVGGDFQGANPEIQNAYRTYVGANSRIGVDAVTAGNGGKAIVWADDTTRYYGNISARGGSARGDGGFVEVSGKNHLDFQGAVSTLAPFGRIGALLLDPTDIQIVSSITGTLTELTGSLFQNTLAVATSQIETANLQTLLGSSNVTIKTQSSGNGSGTVTFSADVIKPATGFGATTLQVEAENHIIVAGGVTIGATNATNPLNVNFIVNSDNSGSGAIKIGNGDQLSTIDTKGGNITLGGTGTNPAVGDTNLHGVQLDTAALNTGTGSIVIRGRGHNSGGNGGNDGVVLRSSLLQTTSGNISIEGFGGLGDTITGHGVLIDGASKMTSASGAISIKGTGASGGSGFGRGVEILSGSVVASTGSATISITGTGGTSDGSDDSGIFIADAGTRISSVDGAIALSGTGGSATGGVSNNSNTGISIAIGAVVESTGAAAITMTGVGGDSPMSGDHGILVTTGAIVRVVNGNIDMTGTGGSATSGAGFNDQGIVLGTAALVESTGSGAVKMVGTGGNSLGGGGNAGVSMFGGAAVRSTSGPIDIQGTGRGAGTGNHGIKMDGATVSSLGSASIAMTGDVTPSTTGNGLEFVLGTAGPNFTIGGASATGDIAFTADSINMPHATVQTAGTVSLRPLSFSRDIFIESGASAGLSLSPNEIQNISANTVEIGRSTDTGKLTVNAALDSADVKATTFKLAHQHIVLNEALDFTTDSENLVLTAYGAISAAGNGAIATGTTTTLKAGGGITLAGANDFNRVVVSSGTNVTLNDINGLVLDGISTSGDFNVTANGTITQGSLLSITGKSSFTAGANPITLTHANNDLGDAVFLNNSGANDVSIVDSGTLTLGASTIGGSFVARAGADLKISGTGTVGGSAQLTAANNVIFDAALAVTNDLTLKAANNVLINDSAVTAGGTVDVSAGLFGINASGNTALLQAGGDLKVSSVSVALQGGVVSGAFGELRGGPGTFTLDTTGDVALTGGTADGAYARIFGNPDVNLQVGGLIKMTAGSGNGAFAAIEAFSPSSISVVLPNAASGGYFVNGVEGTVFDAPTLSGFVAGGVAAVLGKNLNVTYGSALPAPPTVPPALPGTTEAVTTPLLSAQLAGLEQTQEFSSTTEQLGREVTATTRALEQNEKKEMPRLCN